MLQRWKGFFWFLREGELFRLEYYKLIYLHIQILSAEIFFYEIHSKILSVCK